jgi:predicted phosphodiesterase
VRTRRALFLSDVHLGWEVLERAHAELLDHLPAAIDDAEVIVLNGDIIDAYRGQPSARTRELVARFVELVAALRSEGRTVVYVEGNHDADAAGPLVPDRWSFDLEGAHGERIRALHGHRFADPPAPVGPYERYGRGFIRAENWCYARAAAIRAVYPHSIGWLVGAVGLIEDRAWRPGLYAAAADLDGPDVLVHGHFHFGPGHVRVGRRDLHRTGAWVSRGHRGSVDRMLRYEDGVFERITLERGKWIVPGDGR